MLCMSVSALYSCLYLSLLQSIYYITNIDSMPAKKKCLPKVVQGLEPKVETEGDKKQSKKHSFEKGVSIFGCVSHPEKFLKLEAPNKSVLHCKSCGCKISGQHGYLSCTVSGCFQLCSSCKICRQNHFLGRVYALKQFENNPLYSKNMYACNICKEQKEINPNVGIYFCPACDYSICPDCLAHETRIWTDE